MGTRAEAGAEVDRKRAPGGENLRRRQGMRVAEEAVIRAYAYTRPVWAALHDAYVRACAIDDAIDDDAIDDTRRSSKTRLLKGSVYARPSGRDWNRGPIADAPRPRRVLRPRGREVDPAQPAPQPRRRLPRPLHRALGVLEGGKLHVRGSVEEARVPIGDPLHRGTRGARAALRWRSRPARRAPDPR